MTGFKYIVFSSKSIFMANDFFFLEIQTSRARKRDALSAESDGIHVVCIENERRIFLSFIYVRTAFL